MKVVLMSISSHEGPTLPLHFRVRYPIISSLVNGKIYWPRCGFVSSLRAPAVVRGLVPDVWVVPGKNLGFEALYLRRSTRIHTRSKESDGTNGAASNIDDVSLYSFHWIQMRHPNQSPQAHQGARALVPLNGAYCPSTRE